MRSISAIILSMLLASNAYAFAATASGIRPSKATHLSAAHGHRAPATALPAAFLPPDVEATQNSKSASGQASSLVSRIRNLYAKPQGDGLTVRQKLKKSGLPVMMSYGVVSNLKIGGCLSVAWYLFAKQTGLSPLAPQQWKPFMVVYSACVALSGWCLTPIMFAGAVAFAPMWEKMVMAVQKRTKLSKSWSNICVLLVNIVGSLGMMAGGVGIAAALAGVPIM